VIPRLDAPSQELPSIASTLDHRSDAFSQNRETMLERLAE
jgi:hypothetical protein